MDPEQLHERLDELLSGIKRRSLNLLARQFLDDPRFIHRFKLAPAAKSMHHAYLGGLIQHTVSLIELVCRIHDHYPDLDRDLLIMGAFLHDIGKVDEFVYNLFIDYSDAGRLLGHITMGVGILEEKVAQLDGFPPDEALMLKHIILSHHGEAQFGAVKLPMTREAFAIHHADDLDAKMNTLGRILSEVKENANGWSAYQPLFQRFFFRGFSAAPDADVHGESSPGDEGFALGSAPGNPDKTK
jgi:3'-5' exoribonuclease